MYTKYNEGDWISEESWRECMKMRLKENIENGASFESEFERCHQLTGIEFDYTEVDVND